MGAATTAKPFPPMRPTAFTPMPDSVKGVGTLGIGAHAPYIPTTETAQSCRGVAPETLEVGKTRSDAGLDAVSIGLVP